MNKRRIKILVFLLLVAGLISYVFFSVRHGFNELSKNPAQIVKIAPRDYTDLLDASPGSLVLQSAILFKNRNPFAYFLYKNKYSLEMTKISIDGNFNLQNDLVELHAIPEGTYPETKLPHSENGFIATYNAVSNEKATKIYLFLNGDAVSRVKKTDTVGCYFMKGGKIFIQFKQKGFYEIYVDPKSSFSSDTPLSILFVKKKNWLYFILMTSAKNDTSLTPDQILKLLR